VLFGEIVVSSMSWIRFAFRHLLNLGICLFGVLVGFHYDWPDFVHIDYGFPLAWATHTTVTIAGPVDKWTVRLGFLALDIAFLVLVSSLLSIGLRKIRGLSSACSVTS
jgi:hypothetical protein